MKWSEHKLSEEDQRVWDGLVAFFSKPENVRWFYDWLYREHREIWLELVSKVKR